MDGSEVENLFSFDIYRSSRFVGRAKLRLSRDRMRGEINHRFHRFHRLRNWVAVWGRQVAFDSRWQPEN